MIEELGGRGAGVGVVLKTGDEQRLQRRREPCQKQIVRISAGDRFVTVQFLQFLERERAGLNLIEKTVLEATNKKLN